MVDASDFYPYIGQPSPRHAPGGWEEYEQSLGRRLPDDYKRHVDVFGAGIFNGMLMIGHPRSAELQLAHMLEIQSEHIAYLRSLLGEDDWLPYPVSPEFGAMHLWGYSDVGDLCFLVPKGESWIVGIWMREGEWRESGYCFSEWLLRELEGESDPANLIKHLRREPTSYQACN